METIIVSRPSTGKSSRLYTPHAPSVPKSKSVSRASTRDSSRSSQLPPLTPQLFTPIGSPVRTITSSKVFN